MGLSLAIQKRRNQHFAPIGKAVAKFREKATEADLLWMGFELMKLGHLTCEIVHQKPEPAEPTAAKIGSDEKIEVLAARFERGENLYHEADSLLISDDQQSTEGDERW